MAQVATPSLDDVLDRWVAEAVPRWGTQRTRALTARLGWAGESDPTLEEVGLELGITRERVRQLQRKLVVALARTPPPNAAVLAASVEAISDACARPVVESMGAVLRRAGLLRRGLSDDGAALLFDLIGAGEVAKAYEDRRHALVPALRSFLREARDLTRSVGLGCADWALADSACELDAAAGRELLGSLRWPRWLDKEWYWDPSTPAGRNRLVNATTKMLAACGPLELHEVRAGLERVYRNGRLPHIPPLEALRLFYAVYPDFDLADDVLSSAVRLDPASVLDSTDYTFYRILTEAPDNFLDRAELQRQAVAVGMNPNTFSVYTSYSPILDNPVVDRWTLRGADVSPAALEAHRRHRKHRYSLNEWTAQGKLRLEREITGWNLVISLPKALGPYVANRTFPACDEGGSPVGRARWDENGTSWGYSIFLQSRAAKVGDVLVAEFDLVAETVVLSLRGGAQ